MVLWWKFWVFLICFLQNEMLVIGLRLEEVFVPETGIFGDSVTLGCEFTLESDQLLSVKWYKDEHEFYRYTPQGLPPIQNFQVPGLYIKNNSTINKITLSNLTLETGGHYKCEVSSEKPSYRTLHQDGNLTIIVPPDPESPRINNIPSIVHIGDMISGNCTSFKSRPHASLSFYINNQKALSPEVIDYPPILGTWEKAGNPIQLYTSVLGLKFQVGNQHFRQGVIKIRCSAKVGQMSKVWTTDLVIKHQNYPQFSGTGNGIAYGQKPNSASAWKLEGEKAALGVMKVSSLSFLLTWINSRKL